MTKQEALNKIEELKKFVEETDKKTEERVIGIAFKNRWTGEIIFQSTKTTYKEAIIEKGNADLSNADFSNADLRDADLRGAYLRDADLSGADLSGADLRDADLRGADLRGAYLSGAELNCAKFFGRGGTKVLKRSQLPSFLGALGFIIEE
jgi:hypothetical protein